jgi:hypothetical protein
VGDHCPRDLSLDDNDDADDGTLKILLFPVPVSGTSDNGRPWRRLETATRAIHSKYVGYGRNPEKNQNQNRGWEFNVSLAEANVNRLNRRSNQNSTSVRPMLLHDLQVLVGQSLQFAYFQLLHDHESFPGIAEMGLSMARL